MLQFSSSLVLGVARRRPRTIFSSAHARIRHATSTKYRVQARICCRSSSDSTRNSAREEHEQRVAAAQALVKDRMQQHGEKLLQEMQIKEQHKIAKEQKHKEQTVVNSISHWLSKDPSFFASTMDALNLTSQVSSNPKKEAIANNANHPIQVLWDQYRQLYYDSIPTFREQMKGSASNLQFDFRDDFRALEEAGFGEPKWGKRYRQVRGYQVRQKNMIRHTAKAKNELEEQKQVIRRARADLIDLKQEMKLSTQSRERKVRNREAANGKTIQPTRQQSSDQSILSKAWSMILDLFSPSHSQDLGNASPTAGNRETMASSLRIPTTTRIEKRIARKEMGLMHLEDDMNDGTIRLKRLQERQNRRPPPMTEEDYNRANEVVERVRTSVCEKLAKHIRQRHEKLIQQFQTMDAHTGTVQAIVDSLVTH